MKGILHCHSENSRYDSPMSVNTLCNIAKEKGYDMIALTDHGTLTGIDDFVSAAKKAGIKPIPGVEAYYFNEKLNKRLHLVLVAKDDIGYVAISKAVSESNRNIDKKGFPIMYKETLEKYFGKGSDGYGHVFATSACIGGVIGGILTAPFSFYDKAQTIKAKMNKEIDPDNTAFKNKFDDIKRLDDEISRLTAKRDELTILSKKSYKKKENKLNKDKEKGLIDNYEEELKQLNLEKEETEKAKLDLMDIRGKISRRSKDRTRANNLYKKDLESIEKYNSLKVEYDELIKKSKDDANLFDDAKQEVKFFQNIFGEGNFFIEIQWHGFKASDGSDIEMRVFKVIAKIANELGVKMVASNDAHIPDNTEKSIRAREIMCSLRYNIFQPRRDGDSEMYIKDETELKTALKHVLTETQIEQAIQNTYDLLNQCNLEFNYGTHYPKYLGLESGETAEQRLRKMAYEGIDKRFPDRKNFNETYQKRLEYELSVINEMGFSDYFLIVQDFLEIGRKLGHLSDTSVNNLRTNIKNISLEEMLEFIENHQEKVGFSIGAGRGSAAGSLVAYLIGITNMIDPIKYDLLFEREDCVL